MNKTSFFRIVLLLAAMALIGVLSVDILLPSLINITNYFTTNYPKTQLTISLFMFGFGCFQLIYGMIYDLYGRRASFFICISIYILALLLSASANSIEILIISRFIQGISVCGVIVTAFATVREIFKDDECTKVISYLTMIISISPVVGPILGSYLLLYFGWRSNFLFLTIYALILSTFALKFLPASIKKPKQMSKKRTYQLIENYLIVLRNKDYQLFAFFNVIAFVSIFTFALSGPYIFMNFLGLSTKTFAGLFALNAAALIIGNYLSSKLETRLNKLQVTITGASILLIGSYVLGANIILHNYNVTSLIWPILISSLGAAIIIPSSMAGALKPFSTQAGSAAAMTGFLRFTTSGIIATLVSHTHENMITALFGTYLICATAILFISCYNLNSSLWNITQTEKGQ